MSRVTSFAESMPFAACLVSEALYELAVAAIEFLTGALVEDPHRVGERLRGDLAGIHSARRGTHRVLYRTNEAQREVVALRIDHRRDVYRPA
jgi:mRNA interferase RelE/StbE